MRSTPRFGSAVFALATALATLLVPRFDSGAAPSQRVVRARDLDRTSAAPAAARSTADQAVTPSGTTTIKATKTDSLVVDADHDGNVDPGDTIEYRVVIENTGSENASGVEFTDTIDPSTTLDGAPNVSPLAVGDAYTTVGNTLLEVGVPAGSAPAVRVAGSVLANDLEFLGDTYTLTASDASSARGGTVSMNNDGTFTYLPPVGFDGIDQFRYTISDGDLTSVGTVRITVGQRVWYVDNAAPPGGDGRSTAPFDALTPVNGAGGAGDSDGEPGDIVFLHTGSGPYSGGLELENRESLIGQGVDLIVDPGNGPVLLVAAGTRPTVSRNGGTAVALATNNTVRGLDVSSTTGNGMAGAATDTLIVDAVSVSTLGGRALEVSGGTLAVTLTSVAVTNAAGGGVLLTNNTGSTTIQALAVTTVGAIGFVATNSGTLAVTGAGNTISTTGAAALDVSGTTIGASGITLESLTSSGGANGIVLLDTGSLGGLSITGTGAVGSGGSITGATGDAVSLTNVRTVSITDFSITGSGSNHIDASGVTNGLVLTRLFADLSSSDGVRAVEVLGASSLTGSTITRSAGINLFIQSSTATVASPGPPDIWTIAGSRVSNTQFSASGGSGIRFEGTSGANMRLLLGTSNVDSNRVDGLEARAQNSTRVDVRVSGTSFLRNLGSAINVASTQSATAIADVRNLLGLRSGTNTVNLLSLDTSTIRATVDNVQILESTAGAGIRAIQEGNGTVTAQFSNNSISGIAQDSGILCQARAGSGSVHLTINNNNVNNPAVLALDGINVESGSSAGGDANTICLNLSGNNSAAGTQEGYRLRQRIGTTFQLQNFAGNGAVAGDVATWVNATKGNTGTTQILIGTAFSNAPANCSTPPALPVLAEEPDVVAAHAERASSAPPASGAIGSSFASASAPSPLPVAAATFTPADDVPVTIGTLPPGHEVSIVFRVAVDSVIAGGAKQVSNQGSVSGSNFTTVQTDDPDTAAPGDATVTPIDDTLLPQVTVGAPNGGEVVMVGSHVKIAWNAIDNQGVTTVDIRLSRDLGANWEDIIVGTSNTGTYDWTVTPPAANTSHDPVYEALIEVRAHDANGNAGTDVSDSAFAIYDEALPTLLSLFEATPASGGIEVRWRLTSDLEVAVELWRAPEAAGPWSRVNAEVRAEENATVLLDTDIEPGRGYYYRLVATTRDGEALTFGPLHATAAAVVTEFALGSIAPNPTPGRTRIALSLAYEAPVRVGIVDLQGREVAVVLDGVLPAGRHQAVWNGRVDGGPAPAGVYFVHYRSPQGMRVRRIVLAR